MAARESWLKEPRNRKIAVSFLRAMGEGLHLSKTDAGTSKKALRRYIRVQDEATLQGTFEYLPALFLSEFADQREGNGQCHQISRSSKSQTVGPKADI